MPSFSIEHIDSYSQKINTAVLSKSKKVMKHFRRGEQLLEENFIDIASIYSKQSDTLFCLKEVCAASLKKENRCTFMALSKVDGSICHAYCQCPAGKVAQLSMSCWESRYLFSSTVKTDLLHHYVTGLVAMAQKHQRVLKHQHIIFMVMRSRSLIKSHNSNDPMGAITNQLQ